MPTLAVILGGAESVWADLEAVRALGEPDIIIATNHAGRDYPGALDHWVTMHAELIPMWARARAEAGYPEAGKMWSALHRPGPLPMERIKSPGGSSGLLAVYVGLALGVERMILCGVPMCQNGRHYDDPLKRKWQEAAQYMNSWTRALPLIKDRVRSMGGHTQRMLGGPDRGWWNGDLG